MTQLPIRDLEDQLKAVEDQLVQANGRSSFQSGDVQVSWDISALLRRQKYLKRQIAHLKGAFRPITRRNVPVRRGRYDYD